MPVSLPSKPPQEAVSLEQLPAPAMAMRTILRAASDPSVSLHELADLVCHEPSFTVELIRVVNSAFYAQKRPICNARRATVALGARAVRNHAVAHILRVAAQNLDLGDFDIHQFWEEAVRRSTISLVLGELAGCEDPQDASTVGLIQDGGVLLIAATWPQYARQLQRAAAKPAATRLRLEEQLCGINHAKMFGHVADRWGLPSDIVDAVSGHHDPEASGKTRRATRLLDIARIADAIGDVFSNPRDKTVIADAATMLASLPGRRTLGLSEVIETVEQRIPSVAREQRLTYRQQPPITSLVAEAVSSMVQITHHYESATKELEQRLRERQRITRRLEHSNSQLTRLATTDALTGISNRRYFTEVLRHTFDEGVRSHTPTSLVMFDLDHFKNVNDAHGHAAGDDVLRLVAERVGRVLRPSDLLGRLGGEEFAILLPCTARESAISVAERARRAISDSPIRTRGDILIPLTASFGGITIEKRVIPDTVLEFADDAMYKSKTAGRNQITWCEQ